MLAAVYARYSTDRQSESSTADQIRVCRARADAEGWTVAAELADEGVSGSTPVAARPAGRRLLADALARRFEVLLLEGLDRLSRDMVESERVVRRLEHLGIRIVGISDGYDSQSTARKLHRGMRGIVNELYLDDLRHKTHRGLAGQVARGYHAGGKAFGYRSTHDGHGYRLEVDPEQAAVVRWIFDRYAAGASAQRIAHELNARGTPSPRGGTWAVSAIYGAPAKGAGILANETYVGRYVWNRGQWIKDPDTGKRQRVARPRSEWHVLDLPELRIVTDEQWHAVQARREAGRLAGGRGRGATPRTLFGGLMTCGRCGGAVVAVDARRYGCAAAKDRGATVCTGVAVPREAADERLLDVVRAAFLSPESRLELQQAVHELTRAAARQAREADRAAAGQRADLQAEVDRLVEAIAAVGVSPALAARLQAAEARLQAAAAPAPVPLGAVNMRAALADYERRVQRLEVALAEDRDAARRMLAELLGGITIRPGPDGQVWADLESSEPARLLVAGSLLGWVAGARSTTRKRIRLL
jgi:DNA invertase Pin-like site-specific DNA recombinase